MRFIQFTTGGTADLHVGIDEGETVLDLTARFTAWTNMVAFLQGGSDNMKLAESHCGISREKQTRYPKSSINLRAPITSPEKVICIGMNYSDHCIEVGAPIPTEPLIFSKFASAITHPDAPIPYPAFTEELDWEVELVIVIGKRGKNIQEDSAMDYVVGYTVAHDVSARDWQLRKNGGQWLLGKTGDGFLPLGPALVTKDEIADPHNLWISCHVNGEVVQDSSTQNLVFKTEKIVSFVSRFFTLSPGDIISTGTPPGIGCFRKPPRFLKVGDVVRCEIESIGSITNEIVDDSSS